MVCLVINIKGYFMECSLLIHQTYTLLLFFFFSMFILIFLGIHACILGSNLLLEKKKGIVEKKHNATFFPLFSPPKFATKVKSSTKCISISAHYFHQALLRRCLQLDHGTLPCHDSFWQTSKMVYPSPKLFFPSFSARMLALIVSSLIYHPSWEQVLANQSHIHTPLKSSSLKATSSGRRRKIHNAIDGSQEQQQ